MGNVVCRNCGNESSEGVNVCSKCGNLLFGKFINYLDSDTINNSQSISQSIINDNTYNQ